MRFNSGDRVIFKKQDRKGIIKDIVSSYKVIVTDSDGFDMTVSVCDILLVDSLTDDEKAYGNISSNKDMDNFDDIHKKSIKENNVCVVDLHIELICLDYAMMNNTQILQEQLNLCRTRIEEIMHTDIIKFTIIHGIGAGVLSGAVHDLLRQYKLRYYISLDGGSTDVYL